ncbi:MAG: ferredoxin [Paracoccaceae bacterium]
MTLDDIAALAAARALMVMGAFHPGPGDGVPEGTGTLVLLGPEGPGFWAEMTGSPEWHDGRPDPVDRWSRRAIGGMACDLGGKARFPFAGPPWQPFIAWAKRSGRAWASPVTILVHDVAGLFVSYRGAILLEERLDLPPPPPCPCDTCEGRPCLTACPPRALTGAGYDVPACHAFLDTEPGRDCLGQGCLVRRACPVSQGYGRVAGQSAYHMRQFHR